MAPPKTLNLLLAEQERIANVTLQDADNRRLMILAVTAGMISSMALGRLYSKLTPETDDDDLRPVAKAGLLAIGSSVLLILYKVNRAQFHI